MKAADQLEIWGRVGAQLRRPSGPLGRVAGAAMRRINREPYRLALAALEVRPDDQVLELGFGPGEGVRALAAFANRGVVWGVDHSEAMVAQATARNADAVARDQVRLRLARFESLPLDDATVDRVLAVNVAYFWDDGGAVLREIGRVLRPGGRLSVYVTDAAVMRRWRFARSDTHKTFSPERLTRCLAQPPFDPERVRVACVKLAFGVPALVATADR
jgi:SAM-dependent methyltransferase